MRFWYRFVNLAVLLPTNLTSDNVSIIKKQQAGCAAASEQTDGATAASETVRSCCIQRSQIETSVLSCFTISIVFGCMPSSTFWELGNTPLVSAGEAFPCNCH
jgi:hypothetical protein